jgi:multiple sugar transport system substrate-binding protein/arabinosaccharide transport system substrate-binding protein
MVSARPRRFSRRDLLRLTGAAAGAAALPGLLSACGSGAPATPIGSGPVDLSFWTHDDGYIDFFTEALPVADARTTFDYSLAVTKIGASDLVTKLIAQAVTGTGTPDVAGLEVGNFARTLRGDIAPELLVDLTEATARYADDLIQSRVAPFSKDGRLYALDSDTPLAVYYYRQDEFDRLGVPADIETWEELAQVGAAVSAANGGVAFGALAVGSDLPQVVQGYQLLLMQRGGTIFNQAGELDLETPEAENALRFAVDGLRSGFFTTVSDYYGPAMQSGLKTNRIIGVNMPTWYLAFGLKPNVPEQAGLWRMRALPRFSGGGLRTAVGGGTGFAALRDKPNTDAAVQLVLTAYLDPPQQVKRYRDLSYLPTLRSVFDSRELLAMGEDFFDGQRPFEVFRQIVDDVPPLYQSQNQSIMTTVLSDYLLRAYRGDLAPAEALSAATADFRGQTRA